MKKTLKVSIGGLAFTIDEDAYNILDNYLSSLKEYYKDREEGEEIISDVESRVSELLQMKISSSQGVVTVPEVREIVSIMGNPEDFDDKDEPQGQQETKRSSNDKSEEEPPIYRKKLFRDPNHAILSGVCGGLGYFFRVDPVIVRLIFILAFFAMNFFSTRSSFFVILIYLVLWVVMPRANTFRQKLSMVGTDPSLGSVINKDKERPEMYNPNNSKIGTTLVQIIKIFMAVILLITGISILIGAIGVGVCYMWVDYPVPFSTSLNDFLAINGLETFSTIFWGFAIVVLPAIGMIYLGVKLFRRVTMRDIVFVTILILVWFGALFYLGSVTSKVASHYRNQEDSIESMEIKTTSDSLFINLDQKYLASDPVFDEDESGVFKMQNKLSSYFIVPKVVVRQDTLLTDFRLDIEKTAFDRTRSQAKRKAENAKLDYAVNDSLIVVSPKEISRENGFSREVFKVIINAPANKTVVVDPMLKKW